MLDPFVLMRWVFFVTLASMKIYWEELQVLILKNIVYMMKDHLE